MTTENTISKNVILSELSRSPHGSYADYIPVCTQAAKQEPEFLARLIAWNRDNGEIRDSKIALPVISLSVKEFVEPAFVENSLAHLALLDPRNLWKALQFAEEIHAGRRRPLRRMLTEYLRYRESDWNGRFITTAKRYKDSLHDLYARYRISRPEGVGAVLFHGERGKAKVRHARGSVFDIISRLKEMSTAEAASMITSRHIPFLTAKAALGDRIGEPDIMRVLIDRMSPTELTTNVKLFESLGMRNYPAVRGAFEKAMERAAKSKKNILKTTQAAEAVEDPVLKAKLVGLQERQLDNAATIEGDWAILADCSQSMHSSIEGAQKLAGTLSKAIKGKVYLIFFNSVPRFFDVTGKTYKEIEDITKYVIVGGSTSIGCGLQYLLDSKIMVDGIAITSDAQENQTPWFAERYQQYAKMMGNEPSVYLFRYGKYVANSYASRYGSFRDLHDTMETAGLQMTEHEVSGTADYYSLPNLTATLTTRRYGLIDQIFNAKLVTMEMVYGELSFAKGKSKSKRKETAHV